MFLRLHRSYLSTLPTRWAAPFRVGGARVTLEAGHDPVKVIGH